jgi:hypothetical protein
MAHGQKGLAATAWQTQKMLKAIQERRAATLLLKGNPGRRAATLSQEMNTCICAKGRKQGHNTQPLLATVAPLALASTRCGNAAAIQHKHAIVQEAYPC